MSLPTYRVRKFDFCDRQQGLNRGGCIQKTSAFTETIHHHFPNRDR
jgi:hypothetical protein